MLREQWRVRDSLGVVGGRRYNENDNAPMR